MKNYSGQTKRQKKMKCLILGGAGFLGSHLCEGLLAAGCSVRIFDRSNIDTGNIAHVLDRIELYEGDFSDRSHYARITQGIDIAFHLISTTIPKTSNENPPYDVESNIVPTLHFLDAARDSGVKKIIFFSSGGTVYGIPENIPIPETHPTNPICSYGIHKLTIEKYLMLYHRICGLDYGILRISNPFGERQRAGSGQGVIAAFLNRAVKGEKLEIWGDGSVVRDYIYVPDVINAAIKLMNYRGKEKIFNIGSGRGLSLQEVSKAIERAVGYPLQIAYTPHRIMDVPVNVLDIGRSGMALEWKPLISFENGIQNTLKSFVKDSDKSEKKRTAD
jgi:UDP-glucose 4-epimerase